MTQPGTQDLIDAAIDARDRSYAPYSKFEMGAAVLTSSGEVVTGSLVENVSLGLAMCAERVALFSTIARGERPVALALASDLTGGRLTFPCGACLQVALELGGQELVVFAATPDGAHDSAPLRELLPLGPHKE